MAITLRPAVALVARQPRRVWLGLSAAWVSSGARLLQFGEAGSLHVITESVNFPHDPGLPSRRVLLPPPQ